MTFVFRDVSKEELAWKIKTSVAEPWSVRSPVVNLNGAPASQYTPAGRVRPLNSFPLFAGRHTLDLAALYRNNINIINIITCKFGF
jgi:hypothetical protein